MALRLLRKLRMAGVEGGLALSTGAGFLVGALTVAGVWALYPPVKGHIWPIPTLGIASALALFFLYVASGRLAGPRIGDWLVLGYVFALVVAAALVMSWELYATLRARAPVNLGVKTSAAPSVQRHG